MHFFAKYFGENIIKYPNRSQVCEKRQIVLENKTEYIHREKEIMLLLSEFNERKPYFVQLHSTFQVSSGTISLDVRGFRPLVVSSRVA
jgi:hypothetical protein